MKVIDLLNKIAKGEEVPNSFKYEDLIFKRHDDCGIAYYKDNDGDTFLDSMYGDLSNLNDEVEIMEETLEEDKKIEKLEGNVIYDPNISNKNARMNAAHNFSLMKAKINELIDEINKLKEK